MTSSKSFTEGIFYMDMGLIKCIAQDKAAAQLYIDFAHAIIKNKNNKAVLKLILEESINANIDASEDQLQFSKIVQIISEEETTVTKKLTLSEASQRKNEFGRNKYKSTLYFLIYVSLALLVVIILFYQRRMTKKLKMRYQDIIKSLENTIGSDKSNDSTFLQAIDKEVIKNAETENIILENLNQLENKKQFTIKGISLAQMAVMLKTNTKYLNYVLKKHRNADFSKYINY